MPLPIHLPLVAAYAYTGAPLPPVRAQMYELLYAHNGVFARATRPGVEMIVPAPQPIVPPPPDLDPAALLPLTPGCRLALPRVPVELGAGMLAMARMARAVTGQNREILFHLRYTTGWALTVPPQVQGATSVRPMTQGPRSSYAEALVDVHSHHALGAYFSRTDDTDETGLRFYAVLGTIYHRPAIALRLGVYGMHAPVPAATLFVLPPGLRDASCPDTQTPAA